MEENKSLKLQEEKSIEQTSVSDSLPEVCSLSSHLIGGDDNHSRAGWDKNFHFLQLNDKILF